jgi:cellobiose phosphorylase
VEVEDGVIYHKTEYRERRDHFAFFACSEETAGFDTQRDVFLGPYRAWLNPLAVERGESARLPRKPQGSEVRSPQLADHQQADGGADYYEIPGPR